MKFDATANKAWAWVTASYIAVILALTAGKSFYRIGYLWDPANQRVRELYLEPFRAAMETLTVFGALFDCVGNLVFFVPLGWMLAMRFGLGRSVGAASLLSLLIEVLQYTFFLGRTDTTDILLNVCGATFGVALVRWLPRQVQPWLTWLTALAVVSFGVLVIIGPYLGDPDKIVPVA